MQFGLLFGAASNCKKAYDALRDAKCVPEQGRQLLRLVQMSQAPLKLATRLRCRHATQPLVAAAAQQLENEMAACDDLLVGADSDSGFEMEDEQAEAWWREVPLRARDNMTRLAALPPAIERLRAAKNDLQLALLVVQMDAPLECHRGLHPFAFDIDAAGAAADIMRLFDMGRLEAAGDLYPLCTGELFHNGELLGVTGVVLNRASDTPAATYELLFIDGEPDEDEEGNGNGGGGGGISGGIVAALSPPPRRSLGPNSHTALKLHATIPLTRETLSGGRTVDDQRSGYVTFTIGDDAEYTLRFAALSEPSHVCYYPSGGVRYYDVSAEVFEMVVTLAGEVTAAQASQLGDLEDEPEDFLRNSLKF